jgi:hypothetical protein
MTDFLYQSSPWMLPALMLVVLLLAIELPYRFRALLALKKLNTDPVNAVQAGLLTLSAFVLGLSFSQASARYDARRAIVVAEANAIGTTWLRADQLSPPKSNQFRKILTDDTAARLAAYESPYDPELIRRTADRADRDQDRLWSIASSALSARETKLGLSLLMQSLNDTIDIIAQQRQALASHVPTAIVVLTLCLVTLGALSLGLRFALDGSRPLILSIIYVVAYVIVIEMMIDYDRPNTGFVTVSLTPMTEQLQSMQR